MQHTKGPWKWEKTWEDVEFITSSQATPRKLIGDLTNQDGEIVLSCDINTEVIVLTDGDYNLIQTAPDMYEVLKEIDDSYTRCPICKNKKGNEHDYTCKLGLALAKAERRSD